MGPAQDKNKSIKVILFLMALVLCIIGFWRFFPSKRLNLGKLQRESASQSQVIGKENVANKLEGDVGNIERFDQSAGSASLQSARLAVCVIDAQSREEVRSGRINISKEPIETVILTADLGKTGCAEFTLDPGRYVLNCRIPGFYGGGSNALEIESNTDDVRKTIELYRSVAVKGIVKNSSNQFQPDAVVICGKSASATSFAPFGLPVKTNKSGEFSIDWPSNQNGITIYASKPPFGIAKLGPYDVNEIEKKRLEVVLPKEEKTATISGRITDSGMKPIPEATVLFQPMPTFNPSDLGMPMASIYFHNTVKSDSSGYFSLPVLVEKNGTLQVFVNGFEPYREQLLHGVAENIMKDVHLEARSAFSVHVKDSFGNHVDGLNIKAEHASVGRLGPESDQYYVAQYPAKIYADGISHNLGISELKLIESNQKDITLNLGRCEIRGEVVDEHKLPIKNITVMVNSVGGKEDDSGLRVSEYVQFYSEFGRFTLKNLISGTCSMTITANSNVREIFEKRILEINLEEGTIAKPLIVLIKKR